MTLRKSTLDSHTHILVVAPPTFAQDPRYFGELFSYTLIFLSVVRARSLVFFRGTKSFENDEGEAHMSFFPFSIGNLYPELGGKSIKRER